MTTARPRRGPSEGSRPGSIRPAGASPYISLLAYGWPGARKTTLAGSGGKGTLIIAPPTEHLDVIIGSGAEEWIVGSWGEMDEALRHVREAPAGTYNWVWLDSISSFQDAGLDDVFADAVARNAARARYGADKGEYGINMYRLARWVRYAVGAKKFNLGITAWPEELLDPEKDDGSLTLMPWVQGRNMASRICGYMTTVGYLEVKENERLSRSTVTLHTRRTERWYAKDQLNMFESGRLVNPTIPAIEKAAAARKALAAGNATRTRTRRLKRR